MIGNVGTIKHSIRMYRADCGLGVAWADIPCDSQGDSAGGSYGIASLTAHGNFGEGCSVRLEGSRDEEEWYPLSLAAVLTAPGSFGFLGLCAQPKFVRPKVTGGDATTRITVNGFFSCAEDVRALR